MRSFVLRGVAAVVTRTWPVFVGLVGPRSAAAIGLTQAGQTILLPVRVEDGAEPTWLQKPVRASRAIDEMAHSEAWRSTGAAAVSFPAEPRPGNMRVLRVDMQMFRDAPALTRSRLSSVGLRRAFDGEDWRSYNRLSL